MVDWLKRKSFQGQEGGGWRMNFSILKFLKLFHKIQLIDFEISKNLNNFLTLTNFKNFTDFLLESLQLSYGKYLLWFDGVEKWININTWFSFKIFKLHKKLIVKGELKDVLIQYWKKNIYFSFFKFYRWYTYMLEEFLLSV